MLLWLGLGEVLTDAVEDVEPQGEAVLEGQAESLKLSVDASDKDAEALEEKDAEPDARALALGHTLALRLCVFVGDAEGDREPVPVALRHSELVPDLEGLGLALAQALTVRLPLPLPDTLGDAVAVALRHRDGEVERVAPDDAELVCVRLRVRLGDSDSVVLREPLTLPVRQAVELTLRLTVGLLVREPQELTDEEADVEEQVDTTGVTLVEELSEKDPEGLPDSDEEPGALIEAEPDALTLLEGVMARESVKTLEPEDVREGLPLALGHMLGLLLSVLVGDTERDREPVPVALRHRVPVLDLVGLGLALAQALAVRLAVPQLDKLSELEGEAVRHKEGEGDSVGALLLVRLTVLLWL